MFPDQFRRWRAMETVHAIRRRSPRSAVLTVVTISRLVTPVVRMNLASPEKRLFTYVTSCNVTNNNIQLASLLDCEFYN